MHTCFNEKKNKIK